MDGQLMAVAAICAMLIVAGEAVKSGVDKGKHAAKVAGTKIAHVLKHVVGKTDKAHD